MQAGYIPRRTSIGGRTLITGKDLFFSEQAIINGGYRRYKSGIMATSDDRL